MTLEGQIKSIEPAITGLDKELAKVLFGTGNVSIYRSRFPKFLRAKQVNPPEAREDTSTVATPEDDADAAARRAMGE